MTIKNHTTNKPTDKKATDNKATHNKAADKKGLLMTCGLVLVIIVLLGSFLLPSQEDKKSKQTVQEDGDVVIQKDEIGEQASFFAYEVDGIDLEVIAVKASDGTIRTAFNTCQICYASGRGHYVQEGEHLICQNCGNSFTTDDVEVAAGGCNPVPIFAENKIETEDTITIGEEFLKEAQAIFLNWKGND